VTLNKITACVGGLAYGRLNDSFSLTFTATSSAGPGETDANNFDASTTKAGWTVGGGVEGAAPNTHVTWKIEYLYMDLGTRNYTLPNPVPGNTLTFPRIFQ
jgi:outer membrane immunogenic protein